MNDEKWMDLKEYDGHYSISTLGRVKSNERIIYRSDTGTEVTIPTKILAQQMDTGGYMRVSLVNRKTKCTEKVHRLVALAFIENNDINKCQVNHIDGNKTNNELSNLEWVDNSENQKHAIAKGLKVVRSGKNAARFVGGVDVFKDGNYITTLNGNKEMTNFGVDYRLVSAVVNAKRKTHKGYVFKRKTEVQNES